MSTGFCLFSFYLVHFHLFLLHLELIWYADILDMACSGTTLLFMVSITAIRKFYIGILLFPATDTELSPVNNIF